MNKFFNIFILNFTVHIGILPPTILPENFPKLWLNLHYWENCKFPILLSLFIWILLSFFRYFEFYLNRTFHCLHAVVLMTITSQEAYPVLFKDGQILKYCENNVSTKM